VGFWWGAMLTLVVKPQWVHYKLDEIIKNFVVISWPHTKGSVNMLGPHGKTEILVT
jgi:hypothetical protein